MTAEKRLRFYTGARDPDVEALFARELPRLAADVRSLGNPKLVGVWLGGGYGRGEGGVFYGTPDGAGVGKTARPYNDVDFFVFTKGASEEEKDALAQSLEPIAAQFAAVFGADVDFCRPRNPADYKKDEERLMIQELKRGHEALVGGDGLLDHVRALEPGELPRMEALRLFMNRGMGLVFAALRLQRGELKAQDEIDFFVRNLNKAVLGAGDARLIASGRYAWRLVERVARLGDADYAAAADFKFRPTGELPADPAAAWRRARDCWRRAADEIGFAGERTVRQAARWVVRRRTLGPLATFGQDCTERVLRQVAALLKGDAGEVRLPPALERDWQVFN